MEKNIKSTIGQSAIFLVIKTLIIDYYLPMLDWSKIQICEFWQNYIEGKCKKKKCYIDMGSFIKYINMKIFTNLLQKM